MKNLLHKYDSRFLKTDLKTDYRFLKIDFNTDYRFRKTDFRNLFWADAEMQAMNDESRERKEKSDFE